MNDQSRNVEVQDVTLLADGQRVAFYFENGTLIAVHIEKRRLTPEAIEELYVRMREA